TDQPVVNAALLTAARQPAHPLLIVDIAVPRNVDRDVADREHVTLLDLDDFSAWAGRALTARAGAADAVRAIVDDELERCLLESAERQGAPLVGLVHDHRGED